ATEDGNGAPRAPERGPAGLEVSGGSQPSSSSSNGDSRSFVGSRSSSLSRRGNVISPVISIIGATSSGSDLAATTTSADADASSEVTGGASPTAEPAGVSAFGAASPRAGAASRAGSASAGAGAGEGAGRGASSGGAAAGAGSAVGAAAAGGGPPGE